MQMDFSHRPFTELTLIELHDLLWLRNEVFVFGQQITEEPEVDGLDVECVHIIGRQRHDGRIVATARLFMDEEPIKVGRVAVGLDLQRSGVGTQLMTYVHGVIGVQQATLSAQDYLRKWYESLGWISDSDVYDEAGIPHVHMHRDAPTPATMQ